MSFLPQEIENRSFVLIQFPQKQHYRNGTVGLQEKSEYNCGLRVFLHLTEFACGGGHIS